MQRWLMICAISPSQSCMRETLSTLRFAQRANEIKNKAIKNKAIINEEMQEEDANILLKVIEQSRDELHRMKANQDQTGQTGAYATGWSARSLSLNWPMVLPHVENDSDKEMEIVDTDETMSLIREETSASFPGCEDADVHTEDESSKTAVDFKAAVPVVKVDVGVQTLSHDEKSIDKDTGEFLCSKCMTKICEQEAVKNDDAQDMQLVPSNESSSHTCNKLVPKAVEKVLAGAICREMAMEEMCSKQTSEITQQNLFDLGERDVLLEEIQDLREQMDSSAKMSKEESKWISLVDELRMELDMEKKCSEELKEALQMAMEGHARMCEQYAVKKAAAKAGVKSAESKFINALEAENRGLQARLRDTAGGLLKLLGNFLFGLKKQMKPWLLQRAELEAEKGFKENERLNKLLVAPHMPEEDEHAGVENHGADDD